ncbi:hypothetical protein HDF26_003384 [Pedobacter cryoconitis]|uniref:Uncharacterized protein n=1 Tax=Pedobacter cryoconitis TaxID=188932 RepID=A0A7W9DYM6_9SPHI|nr:hypothetical protein [Pedobacter cryoconitis]MBB6272924.1 hypothetical protein [Pedobacter cryoconitis]
MTQDSISGVLYLLDISSGNQGKKLTGTED